MKVNTQVAIIHAPIHPPAYQCTMFTIRTSFLEMRRFPREEQKFFFIFIIYKNVRTIDSNETVYIQPAAHAVLFQALAMYQIRMNIMLRVYVLLWGLVRYCSTQVFEIRITYLHHRPRIQ